MTHTIIQYIPPVLEENRVSALSSTKHCSAKSEDKRYLNSEMLMIDKRRHPRQIFSVWSYHKCRTAHFFRNIFVLKPYLTIVDKILGPKKRCFRCSKIGYWPMRFSLAYFNFYEDHPNPKVTEVSHSYVDRLRQIPRRSHNSDTAACPYLTGHL